MCIAGALLSGCATLNEKAGLNVRAKSPTARQEPWHNLVITGDVRKTQAVGVAFVSLPTPLPKQWKEEFVDGARTYIVELPDGKKLRKPLEKVVFRALLCRAGHCEMFDAVLNPQVTGFFVFLPSDGSKYQGSDLVIVSSDATWLMTTRGEIVDIKGVSPESLPPDLLAFYPSKLNQVVIMDRSDPAGKQFFADMERFFPEHLRVGTTRYSARPDAELVGALFTKVETALDKVISCGSLPAGPGVQIGLAIALVRNAYIMTKDDCFK
jgi:hypothetical protein